MSQRILISEILPEGSSVAWDLSDLQGVTIVDDPAGGHSIPELVRVEDLASLTQDAYLLETVPEGFSLEVGVCRNNRPADNSSTVRSTQRETITS